MLDLEPADIEASLNDAQRSLKVVHTMLETIRDLKTSNPELQFYVMSNIGQVMFSFLCKDLIPLQV